LILLVKNTSGVWGLAPNATPAKYVSPARLETNHPCAAKIYLRRENMARQLDRHQHRIALARL
jgi:hypothetical protein